VRAAKLNDNEILRDWLNTIAAPLWLERGVDWQNGGFFDQLSFSDARNSAEYKRLRVCARQIFVFSRLSANNFAGAHRAVEHGLHFLLTRMRHPEGGFVERVSLDGKVLNSTRDLYDQAFVIFALASAYRLLGDAALVVEARSLAYLISERFAHPAGGFVEGLPPTYPRRQNPHMHLLEACLAWTELGVDDPFLLLAQGLVDLTLTRFWNQTDRRLYEFFDESLSLPSQDDMRRFEPGHHFEWIFLLHEAQRLGLSVGDLSIASDLANTARTIGMAPETGLPYGAIGPGNVVLDPFCRIWQLTEWLRVATLLPEMGGPVDVPAAYLLEFLDVPVRGLWRERRNVRDGTFRDENVPASSLYHIVTGCEAFAFD
jgi:mannose-6-phosphate isomerase